MGAPERLPWTREEFEAQLRAKGKGYHIYHPFHIAMNGGGCTREQVQGWVYNRFYYQIAIPLNMGACRGDLAPRVIDLFEEIP